jgi:hypothetical protein
LITRRISRRYAPATSQHICAAGKPMGFEELLKYNAEMLFMLFPTLRKDYDVINEDHCKPVQLFHEN